MANKLPVPIHSFSIRKFDDIKGRDREEFYIFVNSTIKKDIRGIRNDAGIKLKTIARILTKFRSAFKESLKAEKIAITKYHGDLFQAIRDDHFIKEKGKKEDAENELAEKIGLKIGTFEDEVAGKANFLQQSEIASLGIDKIKKWVKNILFKYKKPPSWEKSLFWFIVTGRLIPPIDHCNVDFKNGHIRIEVSPEANVDDFRGMYKNQYCVLRDALKQYNVDEGSNFKKIFIQEGKVVLEIGTNYNSAREFNKLWADVVRKQKSLIGIEIKHKRSKPTFEKEIKLLIKHKNNQDVIDKIKKEKVSPYDPKMTNKIRKKRRRYIAVHT